MILNDHHLKILSFLQSDMTRVYIKLWCKNPRGNDGVNLLNVPRLFDFEGEHINEDASIKCCREDAL